MYDNIMKMPHESLIGLLKIKLSFGPIAGVLSCILFFIRIIALYILEHFYPRDTIDIAEDFDHETYKENPEKFGDHRFDVRHHNTVNEK